MRDRIAFDILTKAASLLKQQGFYVDYYDDKRIPLTITKEQYKVALGHTTRLQNQTNAWMDTIPEMDDKMFEGLKQLFNDTELENLLAESIDRKIDD